MVKPPFPIDERNKNILGRIFTIMYLLTLISLMVIIFYRQFILQQETSEYNDIAVLFTFNTIILIAAVLYFGGVPVPHIKPVSIVKLYALFVIFGFAFTFLKYKLLVENPLSVGAIFAKVQIVMVICGLFIVVWLLFAWLGKRRLEKELE